MAHHKSAIKRIRRNERARVQNKQYLSSVKTAVKKLRSAVESGGDTATVQPLLVTAQSLLAKAATKGLLHSNNASRRIGRLSALVKGAGQEKAGAADAKTKAPKKAAVKKPSKA